MGDLAEVVIARRQEDAGSRRESAEVAGELNPGQLGHAHVGHEQTDCLGVLPGQLKRPVRVRRLEYGVAGLHEEARHEPPGVVVVDDKDGVFACLNRVPPIR